MKTTIFSYEILCPTCGDNLSGATPADGGEEVPKNGDFSICASCGEILSFYKPNFDCENLSLRKVRDDELQNLKNDDPDVFEELNRVSLKIKMFIHTHKNVN
jgi:hypothetical protein